MSLAAIILKPAPDCGPGIKAILPFVKLKVKEGVLILSSIRVTVSGLQMHLNLLWQEQYENY